MTDFRDVPIQMPTRNGTFHYTGLLRVRVQLIPEYPGVPHSDVQRAITDYEQLSERFTRDLANMLTTVSEEQRRTHREPLTGPTPGIPFYSVVEDWGTTQTNAMSALAHYMQRGLTEDEVHQLSITNNVGELNDVLQVYSQRYRDQQEYRRYNPEHVVRFLDPEPPEVQQAPITDTELDQLLTVAEEEHARVVEEEHR